MANLNEDRDYERMQNSMESGNMDLDHYRKLVKSYIDMVSKLIFTLKNNGGVEI